MTRCHEHDEADHERIMKGIASSIMTHEELRTALRSYVSIGESGVSTGWTVE